MESQQFPLNSSEYIPYSSSGSAAFHQTGAADRLEKKKKKKRKQTEDRISQLEANEGPKVPSPSNFVAVANNTKTTLYTVSLTQGKLGTKGFISIDIPIYYLNNTGGNTSFTITVEWGSEAAWNISSSSVSTNANPRAAKFRLVLCSENSLTSQYLEEWLEVAGAGALGSAAAVRGAVADVNTLNSASQDISTAKTLTVSVTLSSTNANHLFKALGVQVNGPNKLN